MGETGTSIATDTPQVTFKETGRGHRAEFFSESHRSS
jgi:hypothetical protein